MPQLTTFADIVRASKTYPEKNVDTPWFPQMQILKYMGNKRKILNWLIPILNSYLNDGDTILDLFSGTASVGYALKPRVKVLANDIQEYSSVMSSALLEFDGKIFRNDFEKYLSESYHRNLSKLMKIYGKAVESEEKIINLGNVEEYKMFCSSVPRYGGVSHEDKFKLNKYSDEKFINSRRILKTTFPYLLFVTYYPNTFFGMRQCIEIDSLRYSIDQIKNRNRKRVYLSCLIYALSRTVNSSGHFAEFLNHSSEKASQSILEQRNISILSSFLSKLSQFKNLYHQDNWKNKVYQSDYKTLIEDLYSSGKIKDIDLIYIDPPYTNAQYSRFYHIPETLVKYDYPKITLSVINHKFVKGGYRDDRYQSEFSNTSQAEKAFIELFQTLSSKSKATLALSYSDNSIIKPVDKLIAIAKRYYKTIDKKNGHTHSAQGSKFNLNGKGSREVHEYLLICKPKNE